MRRQAASLMRASACTFAAAFARMRNIQRMRKAGLARDRAE
jgi:hypothetical protein